MATVEVRISNALDDITIENTTFANDENVSLGERYGSAWKNALRFRNVTVPQGATITVAYITLRESASQTGTVVRLKIIGNDADNAVSPTSTAEFDALVETTAQVDWDNLAAQTEFALKNTDSIVAIVQEIVDRGSWASGNAMQFMINNDGSDSAAVRYYESFDDEEDEAPLLHIEYGRTYPDPNTDPLRRVSGIRRTFWAGIGGQSVYQATLYLGGISTTYVSPISDRVPPSAVTPTPVPSGAGYQQADYKAWLKKMDIDITLRIFGHFPTYQEWAQWTRYGRARL